MLGKVGEQKLFEAGSQRTNSNSWLISACQLDVAVEILENCFLKGRVIKNDEKEREVDKVELGFRVNPPISMDIGFIR